MKTSECGHPLPQSEQILVVNVSALCVCTPARDCCMMLVDQSPCWYRSCMHITHRHIHASWSTCRQLDGSTRKFWQAANILTFGVARAGTKKKLSHHISFDFTMDLTPYVHPDSPELKDGVSLAYELVAVAVHVGSSCDAGHYLGYCNANAGSGNFADLPYLQSHLPVCRTFCDAETHICTK